MGSLLSSSLIVATPKPSPYVLGNYYIGLMASVIIILLCMSVVFASLGMIFQGFGVYTIARRRGYRKASMAFTPVVGNYVLGAISDDINRYENKKSYRRIWLVLWSALSTTVWVIWLSVFLLFLLSGRILVYFQGYVDKLVVPLLVVLAIALLLQVVTWTVKYAVLKNIFGDYEPENAILFTVLSAFFSFLVPYLLFAIREKPPLSIMSVKHYKK